MGKTIEQIALANGDEVVLKIDIDNRDALTPDQLKQADVVIEFTRPEVAFDNLKYCMTHGVPVISGTTGWLERFEEIKNYCLDQNGAFIYASNFSLGVNLFFALNEHFASLMADYQEYIPTIKEIHHTKKLDAPSGTAITLAEGLIANHPLKSKWINEPSEEEATVSIISERLPEVPGTHEIVYKSAVDEISIEHIARSRDGFAKGAWMAARWLVGKKGVFSMKDVLGLK